MTRPHRPRQWPPRIERCGSFRWHWYVYKPWHLHRRWREATAGGETARQRLVELDRDLRDRKRVLGGRGSRERERSDGEHRTAIVRHVGHGCPRRRPRGERLLQRSMRITVVPGESRLLVFEPGEDHLLAARCARCLDAEHAWRRFERADQVRKAGASRPRRGAALRLPSQNGRDEHECRQDCRARDFLSDLVHATLLSRLYEPTSPTRGRFRQKATISPQKGANSR